MALFRRRTACLCIVARFLARVGLEWVGRAFGRDRQSPAIEEFGRAVAPLLLFAMFLLLVDSAPQPGQSLK
jgi:hypothetical protein